MAKKPSYNFKVCVMGEEGVGKTTLIKRLGIYESDGEYRVTLGVDIKKRYFEIENQQVHLQVWDIAELRHFQYMHKTFFLGSSGVMFVFDVTKKATLDALGTWIDRVNNTAPGIPIIVVGNKSDLNDEREVTFEQGLEVTGKYSLSGYIETSGVTGTNISSAFVHLCQEILQREKDSK